MFNSNSLVSTNKERSFRSEKDLENFIWDNLKDILNLTPLDRQLRVNGEVCDIVCYNNEKQLTVIELKNSEDRYIVQQLSRYYHNLSNDESLHEFIDSSKDIRLIGIAPRFHRHNFIDCTHSNLTINLYEFSIVEDNDSIFFVLKDSRSNDQISYIKLCDSDVLDSSSHHIKASPEYPKPFFSHLDKKLPETKENVLAIRHKIITSCNLISEIDTKSTLKYGFKNARGKIPSTKLTAWFYFYSSDSFNHLFFSLWLPCPMIKYIRSKFFKPTTYLALINQRHTCFNMGLNDNVIDIQLFEYDTKRLSITSTPTVSWSVSDYSYYLKQTFNLTLKDYTLSSFIDLAIDHLTGKINQEL